MKPLNYLQMQLHLEGKRVTGEHMLTQLPDAEEECPLVLMTLLAHGDQRVYLYEAFAPELQESILQQSKVVVFPDIEPISHLLMARGFMIEQGHYKTYRFPAAMREVSIRQVQRYPRHNSHIAAFGFDGFADDVYAIAHEGQIVSACVSVREDDQCGEAWVVTHPDYRHRGYAQMTIQAWASSLLMMGKVPFYSHKIENDASTRIAHRLGLIPLFEEITLSQKRD